jgi:hypothetical protein
VSVASGNDLLYGGSEWVWGPPNGWTADEDGAICPDCKPAGATLPTKTVKVTVRYEDEEVTQE